MDIQKQIGGILVSMINVCIFLCDRFVLVREENISRRWKYLLQQLQEQKGLLGNISQSISVLRDVELVCQELKELQVRGAAVCRTRWS